MKKSKHTLFLIFLFCFSLNSCKNDVDEINLPEEKPVFLQSGQQFANFQNSFLRIIHYSLTEALLTPYMYGFQEDQNGLTRTDCPSSATSLILQQGGGPNPLDARTLTLTFNNCEFTNLLAPNDPKDIIDGEIIIYTFNSIDETFFFTFDKITINNFEIEFIPSNPANSDYVKFESNPGSSFYTAKLSGANPNGGTVFDRSKFICTDLNNMNTMEIYPTYSGNVAFTMNAQNPFVQIDPNGGTTNALAVYESIANNTFEVGLSATFTRFFLGTNTSGIPDEDHIVNQFGSPLIFSPRCKWLESGKVRFIDLTVPNTAPINGFSRDDDMSTDVCKFIDFATSESGNPLMECDNYVSVCECDLNTGLAINCSTEKCY